ncbi:unnamed protein product [Urochloa humidicola]
MDSSYTRWVHHGEDFNNVDVSEQPIDVHYNADLVGSSYGENLRDDGSADLAGSIPGKDVREDDSVDHLEGLLGDLHAAAEEGRQDAENEDGDAEPHDKESFYRRVMEEAKHQLYPGCITFSSFSFVVKILHMKSLFRISNSSFIAILKILAEAFPDKQFSFSIAVAFFKRAFTFSFCFPFSIAAFFPTFDFFAAAAFFPAPDFFPVHGFFTAAVFFTPVPMPDAFFPGIQRPKASL